MKCLFNKTDAFVGLLVLCVFADLVAKREFFSYVILLLLFLFVLVTTVKNNIRLFFFLIPSINYFTTLGMGGNPITFFLLALAVKYFLGVSGRRFSSINLLLAIVVVLIELAHLYITNFAGIGQHFRWVVLFFFAIMLMSEEDDYHSFRDYINYFIVGYFVSAALGVIGYLYSDVYPVNLDLVKRFSGLSGDPNTFGLYSLLVISFVLPRLSKTSFKSIDYVIFFAAIYFAVLTVSRTFLLCFVFLLLVYFAVRGFSRKGLALLMLFVSIGTTVLFFGADSALTNNYLSRLDHADLGGLTGARSGVFVEYINGFLSLAPLEILFGVGVNGYLEYFFYEVDAFNAYKDFSEPIGPHNAFLELFVSFGLIGGLIFLFLLASCLFSSVASSARSVGIDRILPLVALLSYALALQYLGQYSFYFLLLLINLYIKEEILDYEG